MNEIFNVDEYKDWICPEHQEHSEKRLASYQKFRESGRAVVCYDKDGKNPVSFLSIREASAHTKVRTDSIRHAARKSGTAGGYLWKLKIQE
jgi:uncharacterized DUF497 family protein